MTWTNKSLARITIKNYSTRLTLHNMGNGYSMWIKGLRLVKVL